MDAILKRRSIRKYTNQSVPDGIIRELLMAGMSAPSCNNQQPWHFVVITERGLLDEIPKFHHYSQMLSEAPAAILVCGLREKSGDGFWIQDCAAATENILIAIQAKGLGGVWLGVYPKPDLIENVSNLLELPDWVIPFSLIALGYPAEHKPPANRFDETRIHYNNRW
jgi:nitroreductase